MTLSSQTNSNPENYTDNETVRITIMRVGSIIVRVKKIQEKGKAQNCGRAGQDMSVPS